MKSGLLSASSGSGLAKAWTWPAHTACRLSGVKSVRNSLSEASACTDGTATPVSVRGTGRTSWMTCSRASISCSLFCGKSGPGPSTTSSPPTVRVPVPPLSAMQVRVLLKPAKVVSSRPKAMAKLRTSLPSSSLAAVHARSPSPLDARPSVSTRRNCLRQVRLGSPPSPEATLRQSSTQSEKSSIEAPVGVPPRPSSGATSAAW